MHRYRSHTCGDLRAKDVGSAVRLSGWVHRKRNHGGVMFIDLRDHYGLTQLVVQPDSPAYALLDALRAESVVRVDGQVVARTAQTINPNLASGEIEVRVDEAETLGEAQELPIPVFGDQLYPEELRLRYRFLDLRREELHRQIMLRGQVIRSIRRRMEAQGFFEFQTPILTASSPEGARDFLVPSRMHPGKFYALPQAPQQFKQLIMVAGFDRYFQIAPCFRDEDARADRSPGEFYQLDVEMSFVEQEDVFQAIEPVMRGVFEEFAGPARAVRPGPFPRIAYREAMLKFGSDKPDLRNPIEICDVSDVFANEAVSFKAFSEIIAKGGVVRAIPAPKAGALPRSFFDKLNEWARKEMQAPGLGYLVFEGEEAKGPIAKFLPPAMLELLKARAGVGAGDALFFSAGPAEQAAKLAGQTRIKLGQDLDLIDESVFAFCWIVDFPMFEWNEEEKRVDFSHNPFSMPQGGLEALERQDPLTISAFQYDIVCNGVELSSGAIRNHRPDIMLKAFAIAGYGPEVVEAKFGGMLNAFRYGAPPHGGIAPGIDRIVMLLAGVSTIRDVILFPLNQQAQDLMMNAPNEAAPKHLQELHLRLVEPAKKP